MPIAQERARLVREIDAYLRGRHDADKKRIATSCKAAVPLAINHGELKLLLEAYRAELTRYVGQRNARRWFSHRAGGFDDVLAGGIERCTVAARNEARAFAGTLQRATATTVKDWRRHGGGMRYDVNGLKFADSSATIDDIHAFFARAGITSARMRTFLCDHANQDGLHGAGHLFVAVAMAAGVLVSNCGSRHLYRGGAGGRLQCTDVFLFNAVTVLGGETTGLEPPLEFKVAYSLVEMNGAISLVDPTHELLQLDQLPEQARSVVESAFETFEAP